jgi:hypothetical protein
MKPVRDWLKQMGFSGVVLSAGLIVATTSSVGSATPVPVESASSQANSGAEDSQAKLKLEDAIEPMLSLPVVTAEGIQGTTSDPKASLNDYPLVRLIPIGFFNVTFHTPPAPLIKGGAIREYVSNSNPIDITPAEALSVSHSAADLLVVNRSNSQSTHEAVEAGLTLAENSIAVEETQLSQAEPTSQPQATPKPADGDLDLSPEIIENSPVLQRWQRQVPNVLEEIRHDPSFRTRLRLGYSHFPSTGGGFNVGVEDVFLSRTGLTVSGDYHRSFNGKRESYGADLRYYVLPLGSYVNFAPQVGYRNLTTGKFSTDGVNVGARLMLALSRTGAADVSLTQSFVSPGSSEEVGITTLSVGYAVTQNLRLSTDIQKQNSKEDKDSRVGIVLEWMP